MRLLFLLLFTLPLFAKELILVAILPQKYFVEQIANDKVEVKALVPKGASPATYSLKPSDLKAIKKASVYFTIGVPFERMWLDRIQSANPKLKIIDCGEYTKRFPLTHDGATHPDPHIWLAPNYAVQIVRKIAEELSFRDPKNADIYISNMQKLIAKIGTIDQKIFQMRLHSSIHSFLVYHPSFGYFAKVYHLRQIAIEHEGKEPKSQDLLKIIKIAKKEGIKTIFIEPQFPRKSAKFLAQRIGAKVVVIDPLAYEWDENIVKVARAIFGD
ncbi:metal ABC transporter solute-binding protein, Zn/Mn family [Nitratiruptor sp. YY09-18]|uniref:metal ABC transporter solute-binding protein, Zn/Mn family n=1 Tax=Nitratiruptor sp. YY09-18 TaxID=2724901 RepID=UPI001916B9CF|nr:zinc ABC transporter substrate-binding protein [Nitratiruptor sp. YY09-18]BCD67486.1 zinc transport system substrate-binding protein [Nitratiruptor sp. YY09-18]